VNDNNNSALPIDSAARKNIPLARGVLDYFPAALAAIARLSQKGNDKHNPGEELHWARGKSMDHADCIMRHLADRGTLDPDDNEYHEVKMAWRALALLQEAEEKRGAPMARGARLATPPVKERAWNEGWVCPRCGTTELHKLESPQTVTNGEDILCATPYCLGDMVRV
jgi:hypothetical protein